MKSLILKNIKDTQIHNSMFENRSDENEEKIRLIKDKKLSKHFLITINDKNFKIIKFIIKDRKPEEGEGKKNQLISKYDIIIPETKNVKINIEHEGKSYEIVADHHLAWWGLGKYFSEYLITQIDEK